MLTVTKKFNFSYAHRLPNYDGDCANMHGHNSEVEVEFTYSGLSPRAYVGMIVDFKTIKKVVGPIIDQLDHSMLNGIPGLEIPTAENIVQWLCKKILVTELGPGLSRVRVSETPDSYAEWRQ